LDKSFNPCFYGISSSTLLPLRQYNKRLQCFNPCFYGISSSTSISITLMSMRRTVSILVFMESVLQQERLAQAITNIEKFQSLFLWNQFFNTSKFHVDGVFTLSFNPCFYGISSSTASYDF